MFLTIYRKHFDSDREIKLLHKFPVCTTTFMYEENNVQLVTSIFVDE